MANRISGKIKSIKNVKVGQPPKSFFESLQDAGIESSARVILDAGDTNSYSGSGTSLTNLATGESDWTLDAESSYVAAGESSYFNQVNPINGWAPTGDVSWANSVHKVGGACSWMAVVRINTTERIPFMTTQNGSATAPTSTGYRIVYDTTDSVIAKNTLISNIGNSESFTALRVDSDLDTSPISGWAFVGGVIAYNSPSFFRLGASYIPLESFRKVNTTTSLGGADTVTQTYASPNSSNASQLRLFGWGAGAVSSPANSDIDINCIAVYNTSLSITDFNNVYSGIAHRLT